MVRWLRDLLDTSSMLLMLLPGDFVKTNATTVQFANPLQAVGVVKLIKNASSLQVIFLVVVGLAWLAHFCPFFIGTSFTHHHPRIFISADASDSLL